MKTICFYFQVHQPYRLHRYRFFDIGNEQYYYDDYANKSILRRIAKRCYLPANKIMLELIKKNKGKFKISYSITGTILEQFQRFMPEVLKSFQELAATGCVEFLAETYAHSLSSLNNKEEFASQVQMHHKMIEKLFGQSPKVFRNTELIYSDKIGEMVADMGYKAMLCEGAKHILGWKSPNFIYYNAINPRLKLLLKNYKLSDDIAFRFSDRGWPEWPLTVDKYVNWLNELPEKDEVVNLFIDYETFGEHQWEDTGIFEFIENLPDAMFKDGNFKFATPTEVATHKQPVAALNVPYPISWADEERDVTAWLGNELQNEAFEKLNELAPKIRKVKDKKLLQDWQFLQTSDHFYYMCTKFFADGAVHQYFNPYNSPYDAFINYMNVLSDFKQRVEQAAKELDDIDASGDESYEELIEKYEMKLRKLKAEAMQNIQQGADKNTEIVAEIGTN